MITKIIGLGNYNAASHLITGSGSRIVSFPILTSVKVFRIIFSGLTFLQLW